MDRTKLLKTGNALISKFLKWLAQGKNIYIFIIVILFSIIIGQRMFPKKVYITEQVPGETIYIKDTIVKYDTVTYYDVITELEHDTIYVPDTIVIEQEVDTMDILKDYFAVKEVVDTLINDTSLFAKSQYIVTQNTITRRAFEYENRIKTEIIQNVTVVNPLKNKLFATLDIGGRPVPMTNTFNKEGELLPPKFGIFGGLRFQTKTDRTYSVKVDPFNKELYVGIGFKLLQYGNTK